MNRLTIAAPASAGQFVVPALAGMRRLKAELQTASAGRRRLKAELRAGFTLVELLITISIISILVTMSMGALFMAQESARYERTQGLIGKLHNVVIDRWESYRMRRLPFLLTPTPLVQLQGVRDVMRMEMPDRYEDLLFDPTIPNSLPQGMPAAVKETGLRHNYLRRVDAARKKYNAANNTAWGDSQVFIQNVLLVNNPHQSAECLYMFILGSMPADERAEFKDKDYADTNGNFMPEFIDAWGHPIHFLRWAPGFLSDVHLRDPIDHHDPFDPYSLQMGGPGITNAKGYPAATLYGSESTPSEWGFAMLPLIFSAGPDGAMGPDGNYGIQELIVPPADNTARAKNRFPFAVYAGVQRGDAVAVNSETVHFDNIHNHNPVGFGK